VRELLTEPRERQRARRRERGDVVHGFQTSGPWRGSLLQFWSRALGPAAFSFPPPALGESSRRGLARRLGRRAIVS
jgi:hypothetical protein